MKTKNERAITFCSLRFCIGCAFAVTALFVSVHVYDNLKAGVFFAVMFVAAGAFKIPETAIPHRLISILYKTWGVVTAIAMLFFSQLCLNEGLPEGGIVCFKEQAWNYPRTKNIWKTFVRLFQLVILLVIIR